MKRPILAVALLLVLGVGSVQAQQRIGFVDSETILSKIPEYADVQQKLDRLVQDWQEEIEAMQQRVDEQFRDYQARELLFTKDERQRRQEEIIREEERVEQFRRQKFGPEGELFQQQQAMMRPIQERIVAAIDAVARAEGYDFVFDKSGDFLFLYARDTFDLSNRVLDELGIRTDEAGR